MKTNVAKYFLQLIDLHFPPHHKLHDIKILEKNRNPSGQLAKGCNCRDKSDCPLPGNCQEYAIIYNAEVKQENSATASYIGLCEPTFKKKVC